MTLEQSPGFDCQPLDMGKVEMWREAIADELQSNSIERVNPVFIKELLWLKQLYLEFAVGRLPCDIEVQKQAALWMLEVDRIADSFLIKFVMERESEN